MRSLIRILLTWAAFGFLYTTCAAQDRSFHGQVVDADDGHPLSGAHIVVAGRASVLVSDPSGRFMFPWDHVGTRTIVLSHIGFERVEQELIGKDLKDNGPYVIRMVRMSIPIPEVLIRIPAPEVVYQREDLHVGDHFPTNDGLWVLVYDRPQMWHKERDAGAQLFKEAGLHLLDTLFRERMSCPLPERVRQLHRDHQGRIIVEGEYTAWLATVQEDRIQLHSLDRQWLHTAVLPWTDSIAGALLGNTSIPTYPSFDHIAYDPLTKEQHLICSVEERHTMELFRSQYKYMSGRDKVIAMDLELETGVDREVIAGYLTAFHDDPYFRLPYAPLFVVDDVLCVFDHTTDRIRRFDRDREHERDVPITYHHEREWNSRLLQDPASGAVHALYKRGPHAWLRCIDTGTGVMGERMELTHPYPEAIRVFNGYVYYVYRPFGSLQHRTLYREALR